jgi:hypothetical protein
MPLPVLQTHTLSTPNIHIDRPTYLGEPNGSRLLTEALAADVQAVFPDQTSLVSADAAEVGL